MPTYAPWTYWCNTSATTTGVGIKVWQSWNSMTTAQTTSYGNSICYHAQFQQAAKPLTAEEQRAADERMQQERERRRLEDEKRTAERKVAAELAEELLKEHLDDDQRQEFERSRIFHVIGQTGKRYRVKCARSGNVEELDDKGQAVNRFCIHPVELVPDQDTLLAQKLLLQHDEAEFRRIANKTRLAAAV